MADEERLNLAKATFNEFTILRRFNDRSTYPWSPDDVDRLESKSEQDEWKFIVNRCRYFYKRDPLVSTVINKIIDLAINGFNIRETNERKAVTRVVEKIETDLLQFCRNMALEYMISGLVIPEITYTELDANEVGKLGIPRFTSLILPTDMWVRDPRTIIIRNPVIGGNYSYFVEIPEDFRFFIQNKGEYPDGTQDKELYKALVENYPDFVRRVRASNLDKVLLEDPTVIRYRSLPGDSYPTPYLYPVLESLEHKRNLRRMDYSIAARVISAIQKITLGNDDFPLTEDNEDQLEDLKKEMQWREKQSDKDMERIFQLFGNHTLEIEWIFPDVKPLLDEAKYKNVNQDIVVGLGFPRILVTGETEKSFTSDAEIATISPQQTIERLRELIFPILVSIIDKISTENNLGNAEIHFKPVNMMAMSAFVQGLQHLYETGNLSREDYDAFFGLDFYDQTEKRAKEKEALDSAGLDEFAPVPHSNEPSTPSGSEE